MLCEVCDCEKLWWPLPSGRSASGVRPPNGMRCRAAVDVVWLPVLALRAAAAGPKLNDGPPPVIELCAIAAGGHAPPLKAR